MPTQNLEEIWKSLEDDLQSAAAGFVLARRLHPDSRRDIRVAVDPASRARMLLVRVVNSALDGSIEFPRSRGFELRFVPMRDEDARHRTLGVILTRADHADVFTSLVADISSRLAEAESDRTAVSELIGRLVRWQAFLQRHEPEGLGLEEQRGLYGELWLMRHRLVPSVGPREAVNAWSGPGGANHDFQLHACAIEVKATTMKQHQLLHIASERQLDDTGAGTLLLFHLSLDEREHAGETLPAMVGAVRELLDSEPLAREALESRLIDAGYLDAQAGRYIARGYTPRQSNFFRVGEGFPRIIERDLRPGVGDVRYTIAVATCLPHAVSEEQARGLWEAEHAG